MALPKNPKVDLKAKYQRTFELGLIFALSFLILAFKFFPEIERKQIKKEPQKPYIDVYDIPPTKEQTLPPRPPIPIEAPIDILPEDEPIFKSTDLISNVPAGPPPPVEDDSDDEPIPPYIPFPEVLPQPIGGISEIQKKIIYPEIAVKAGVQGKVVIEAKIDTDGYVYEAAVLKGIGAGCDEEAMRVILNTRFKPGVQGDKLVRTRVVIPIIFDLN